MDKLVGIVTLYHRNHNYGGLLQAFALQKVVGAKAECEVLTFDVGGAGHIGRRIAHFNIAQTLDAFRRKRREGFSKGERRAAMQRRSEAFENFEAMIPHSPHLDAKALRSLDQRYGVLMCGSDQVWNPAWWNKLLLLEGVDGSRVVKTAYAASMGCSSLARRDEMRLGRALADFCMVSVREKSACALLERATGGKVVPTVTLDPTLLLSRNEWLRALPIQSSFRMPSKPYAFIYLVDKENRYTKKSVCSCMESGLDCVVVSYDTSGRRSLPMADGVTVLDDCRPDEWLHLLAGAQVVLTDSFHGVAFSSNFGKPFWCFRKTETLNGSHKDDRQEALLERLGLSQRIIEAHNDITSEMLREPVSFVRAQDVLTNERAASLQFIEKCLEAVFQ